MFVEYDSNNSGGRWWLTDENWKELEKAGWIVHWASHVHTFGKNGDYLRRKGGIPKLTPIEKAPKPKYGFFEKKQPDGSYRYLGALARRAYKPNCESLRSAAQEWERVTGLSATDAGCACCGQPHNFTLYDDKGNHVESGPHASYEAHW